MKPVKIWYWGPEDLSTADIFDLAFEDDRDITVLHGRPLKGPLEDVSWALVLEYPNSTLVIHTTAWLTEHAFSDLPVIEHYFMVPPDEFIKEYESKK